jgi:hypothetical protein
VSAGNDDAQAVYEQFLYCDMMKHITAQSQAAFFAYGTGMRWPTRPAYLPKEVPAPAEEANVTIADLDTAARASMDCGDEQPDLTIPPIRPCYVCDADTGVTREGVPMCIKCRP